MKLGGMLAAFDKTVTDATRDQLGYSEFLDVLLQAEADYRGERVAQRRLKAAKLPTRVSLDDFDYTARRSITKAQIREIQGLGWLKDGRPLLLIGQTGVGKSSSPRLSPCRSARTVARRSTSVSPPGSRTSRSPVPAARTCATARSSPSPTSSSSTTSACASSPPPRRRTSARSSRSARSARPP
jgi:hypothetical protein